MKVSFVESDEVRSKSTSPEHTICQKLSDRKIKRKSVITVSFSVESEEQNISVT
jgi:hypothetical protein